MNGTRPDVRRNLPWWRPIWTMNCMVSLKRLELLWLLAKRFDKKTAALMREHVEVLEGKFLVWTLAAAVLNRIQESWQTPSGNRGGDASRRRDDFFVREDDLALFLAQALDGGP